MLIANVLKLWRQYFEKRKPGWLKRFQMAKKMILVETSCIFGDHWNKNEKYFKNGGERAVSGIRFPPLIMQYIMLVLAKTSHPVYNTFKSYFQGIIKNPQETNFFNIYI